MKNKMKNKTITQLFYRLLIKDFDSKLESADATYKMIMASTHGKISHFYNDKGEKIRGYHKHSRSVVKVLPTNSLIVKYGN